MANQDKKMSEDEQAVAKQSVVTSLKRVQLQVRSALDFTTGDYEDAAKRSLVNLEEAAKELRAANFRVQSLAIGDESLETKDNMPSLRAKLTKRLDDWLERQVPRVHVDECAWVSITFEVHGGQTSYLDDGTPFVEARVKEHVDVEEQDGWIPKAEKGEG